MHRISIFLVIMSEISVKWSCTLHNHVFKQWRHQANDNTIMQDYVKFCDPSLSGIWKAIFQAIHVSRPQRKTRWPAARRRGGLHDVRHADAAARRRSGLHDVRHVDAEVRRCRAPVTKPGWARRPVVTLALSVTLSGGVSVTRGYKYGQRGAVEGAREVRRRVLRLVRGGVGRIASWHGGQGFFLHFVIVIIIIRQHYCI